MRHTEGLEEKLNQILNDPDSMAQIMSMAQSFGFQPESEPSPPPSSLPDEDMLRGMMQLFQQMQQNDGKQEALLRALKPYLAPDRREKLDKAMQLARLSHIAGFAFGKSGGLFSGKG